MTKPLNYKTGAPRSSVTKKNFFNSVKLEFQYRKIGAKRTFQQGMGVSSAFSSAQ